jgi:hypothetical protein
LQLDSVGAVVHGVAGLVRDDAELAEDLRGLNFAEDWFSTLRIGFLRKIDLRKEPSFRKVQKATK